MVIFTYEDYLKYKETQNYILSLRKKIEEEKEQLSYKCILNDIEENYILKLNEEKQSKTENVTTEKSNVRRVNNEHEKQMLFIDLKTKIYFC